MKIKTQEVKIFRYVCPKCSIFLGKIPPSACPKCKTHLERDFTTPQPIYSHFR